MIIKLLEPLGVPNALIEKLASPLEKAGHNSCIIKKKHKERAGGMAKDRYLMIANNPYPKEAFQQAKNLKLINVTFRMDHVDQKRQSTKYSNHKCCRCSIRSPNLFWA